MVVGRRERGNEVQLVYFFLRRLDVFRGVDDQTLRTICQSARYEQFQQAGKFLYKKGQRSFCWYILLSGAVFCDGRIYLPVESMLVGSGVVKDLFYCLSPLTNALRLVEAVLSIHYQSPSAFAPGGRGRRVECAAVDFVVQHLRVMVSVEKFQYY
ncbi:conserved hypothetical protein [Trichinella spiralis]|uniref:hypothetical protein n=1 Tax=Trichinella spiralis TaxID=6334 RepID=UPI0001EFC5D8|nr:conserved hypothetical protein [Trichinella spiralis]